MDKKSVVEVEDIETGEVVEFNHAPSLILNGYVYHSQYRRGNSVFLRYKHKSGAYKSVQVFTGHTELSTNVDVVRETLRKLTMRERQRLQQQWGKLVMDKDDDLVKDENEDDEDVISRMADGELEYLSERIQAKLQMEEILLTRAQLEKREKARKASPPKPVQSKAKPELVTPAKPKAEKEPVED